MASGATVRQVELDELGENLATLREELSEGHALQLVKGGRVVADVVPRVEDSIAVPEVSAGRQDFADRMRAAWGDQRFPEGFGVRLIREDRDGRG